MKKKITTLAELEQEQEKLKMMMELTRQEFARNLGTNRKQLSGFVLKKVALPLGAASVGVAVSKSMAANNNTSTSVASKSNLFKKLLPLGLNLLQAYLVKQQKEKLNNTPKNINQLKSVA